MSIKPLYDTRPLTEQESEAYTALIAKHLPGFMIMSIMGEKEGTGIVCITLETVNGDESVFLYSPHEVTNFLNFVKMQQSLKGEQITT